MPLLGEEKQELGHADVVFLPVGLQSLSVNDFNQIVKDLGATLVIPINYKTDKSGDLALRSLDEYLAVRPNFPFANSIPTRSWSAATCFPPSPPSTS